MAYNLIIKPIVIIDAEDALRYYDSKVDGLGQRFYSKFIFTLSKIQTYPFAFSYVKKPIRRCRIQKYPYKIFYIVRKQLLF